MTAAALLWAGALALADTDTDPHTDVPDPLADGAFSFCHEAEADADEVATWCRLLEDAPPDVCPGMRETCRSGKFEAQGCASGADPWSGGLAGAPGESDPWRPTPRTGCDDPQTPQVGAAFLRWLLAALVAGALFAVLRLVLRLWGRSKPRATPALADEAGVAVVETPLDGDDDFGATPEDELLARARAALASGRLADAVLLARGAALRRLMRRGLIVLHKSRTDREYLRAVTGEPDTRDALRDVLGATEDVRWAERPLTEPRAVSAVASASRILAALLIAVGLLAPRAAWADRRYAPHGDAALWRFMEGAGLDVVTVSDLTAVDASTRLVVLDGWAIRLDDAAWAALDTWVRAGGVLLLAGGPDGPFADLGETQRFTGLAPEAVDTVIAATWRIPVPRWPNGPVREICVGDEVFDVPLLVLPEAAPRLSVPVADTDPADTDSDARVRELELSPDTDAAEVLLGAPDPRCPEPVIVGGEQVGDGWVVVLADPMLLRNAAMIVPDNRTFLFSLLRGRPGAVAPPWALLPGDDVVLATETAGAQPASPYRSVANAHLLPFLLHLFVFWLLLALWRGWPLSPLREPPPQGRPDFADHIDALGRHWEAVGASRHAAREVARLALTRLGAPGLRLGADRIGLDGASLLARTQALVAAEDGPDDPSDFLIMEDLWKVMSARQP